MSVLRGRPPGLAGGISGTRRAYCSSLRACPAPKSPTKARLCAVHTVHLQEGSLLPEPPTSLPCAPAYPSRSGFSNGLLSKPLSNLVTEPGVRCAGDTQSSETSLLFLQSLIEIGRRDQF